MPTGLPFSKFPARAETPLENLDGGPCSASAVSAAGSASAAQHFIRRRRRFGGAATRPLSEAGAFALLRLADFRGGTRCALAKTGARRQQQLPPSATGSGRCCCPRPHSGCIAYFMLFHGIALKSAKQKSKRPKTCVFNTSSAFSGGAGDRS